ncbi:MAG: PD-(D/E)XK nuclease family transposase [Lachnospiraceae bacterium]|nr:PD-(D/E)XK nuclease family transposase [Lachnospiraceae bacterium]
MNYKHNSSSIFTPGNPLPKTLQEPRLRAEILTQINNDPQALFLFQQLDSNAQEALIEFCMGNRGLQITYDPFFHHIFNTELYPERLNRLLSSLLQKQVRVKQFLPREGIRLSDSSSLVIMDVLVELEDGSLVNVEIQKYGYYFPMQRSFCYGADLLVRQYAKLRDSMGKNFNYSKLHPVYIIVLMDNSPADFHKHSDCFLHQSEFCFSSGLTLGNLLNFIYIPLDIFRQMPHNNLGELEAWLYFLSSDNPFHIQMLIEKYPFFIELYRDIINFRYHPKELITMYSEALAILDRNTVNLMIDDMKKELEEMSAELAQQQNLMAELKLDLSEKSSSLSEINATLTEKEAELSKRNAELSEKNAELSEKNAALSEKDAEIARLKALLEAKEK